MTQDEPPAGEHDSDAKLAEAMLYVAHQLAELGDRYRGAVKLNKVLWRADFESYRRTGRSVTGTPYQRLPEGPAPIRLVPVRNQLEREGHAHREDLDVGAPRKESVLVAEREADPAVLTATDREALDEAIRHFFGKSGSQASELSHRESAGWQAVADGEVIPYETVLIDTTALEFPAGTQSRVAALIRAHEASIATLSS